MPGLNALQQRRKYFVPQNFPCRGITEELSDIDEQRIQQLIEFVGMLADVLVVIGVATEIELEHAPAKAAFQRALLIAAKVEVTLLREFLQKVF